MTALPVCSTPDGRYLVVRGRLWRKSNPNLTEPERKQLVSALMSARRAIGAARRKHDKDEEASSRGAVNTAKHALGERGPIWWADNAPDLNRMLVRNTIYADWFAALEMES